MTRRSGLYARYFVPVVLQPTLGSRYLVMSLLGERRDAARFTAARIGYVLSRLFEWMRKNPVADPKDLLSKAMDAARQGRQLIIDLPDGTRITTDGSAADYEAAQRIMGERERIRVEAGTAFEANPNRSPASASDTPDHMLSACIPKFIEYMRGQGIGEKNLATTENVLRLFTALTGDKQLRAVSADDIESFLAALQVYPANASKKKQYDGLAPPAIVEKARAAGSPGLSARTREKYLDRLRVFFGAQLKRRRLDFNPCDGFRITTKTQDAHVSREPFSPDDLATIFEHNTSLIPHQYWVPVLALYSGARLNELAQLKVDDIEEIVGIVGMHIRHKVKNKLSRRFVPLHPELLRLGFVDYLTEVKRYGFAQVFPGLENTSGEPGDVVGDWFNRTHLRNRCKIMSATKVFHSFRHTFATTAERAGVPDGRIGQLTGHSTGGTVLRDLYIHAATLPDRFKDISKVKFPTVKLTPRAASLFEHYLRRERALQQRAQRSQTQT